MAPIDRASPPKVSWPSWPHGDGHTRARHVLVSDEVIPTGSTDDDASTSTAREIREQIEAAKRARTDQAEGQDDGVDQAKS